MDARSRQTLPNYLGDLRLVAALSVGPQSPTSRLQPRRPEVERRARGPKILKPVVLGSPVTIAAPTGPEQLPFSTPFARGWHRRWRQNACCSALTGRIHRSARSNLDEAPELERFEAFARPN
jgi:hypothetical protein